MKVAIMQPYFFPYIGYYQMVNACDKFVFYDSVNYMQRGYINRNQILSVDGKQYFTVPVKKSSLGTKIIEILISDYENWKIKFLNQIKYTYSKAPYFKDVYALLENFLVDKQYTQISDLASSSIIMISDYLNIKREFIFSSDLQGLSNLEDKVDKVDKLEYILHSQKANAIILPPGSKLLYKDWQPKTLEKNILAMPNIDYKQFNKQFVENLSIIDVLMFNTPSDVLSFIQNFKYQ